MQSPSLYCGHTYDIVRNKNSTLYIPVTLYPTVMGKVMEIVNDNIHEIKKIGKDKILVQELSTYTAANNLLKNSFLAKHNLKAFIP